MKHWQQLSVNERRDVLEITSSSINLPQMAVEKDWWVTMILNALSKTRYCNLMSFKGGTSLSKGWNLINRFSEDIDIALRREDKFSISSTSGNQLAKVRRSVRHYVIRELPQELAEILNAMQVVDFVIEPELTKTDASGATTDLGATTHPSTIYIHYKSILADQSDYIAPAVKIEISCLSMDEPIEYRTIRSFVSDTVQNVEDMEVCFATVVPGRTFIEKLFLLHEEFQKKTPRSKRMSRHLYDIEKIMDTEFGSSIWDRNLYESIINHRSIFNKIEGVNYDLHAPSTLSFLPPEKLRKEWEKDYNSMRSHFIYEEDCLTFDKLMERMKLLAARIKGL